MVKGYQVTELITPGLFGDVLAVNNLVLPCGATYAYDPADLIYYATLWFSIPTFFGTQLILPVPITPGPFGSNDAFFDINDDGDVVGGSAKVDPDIFPLGLVENDYTGARALLLEQGKLNDLSPILGGFGSVAYGISNRTPEHPAGLVTGVIQLEAHMINRNQGFVYDPAAENLLPIPPLSGAPDSVGVAINKNGVVAGFSGGHVIAFNSGNLIDLQPGEPIVLTDVSVGVDINDNGQIVSNAPDPAIYDLQSAQPALVPIAMPPTADGGTVSAVNNGGDTVGAAIYRNILRAFIQNKNVNNGVAIDLNILIPPNSGWVLTSANDISDNGYIVRYGTLNGRNALFLLTPVVPVVPPALEVKSLMLFPSTIIGGGNSRANVTLSAPVPHGQTATVFIGTSDPLVAKPVIQQLQLTQGQTGTQFQVRTFPISPTDPQRTKHVTITAALGVVRNALLTVTES